MAKVPAADPNQIKTRLRDPKQVPPPATPKAKPNPKGKGKGKAAETIEDHPTWRATEPSVSGKHVPAVHGGEGNRISKSPNPEIHPPKEDPSRLPPRPQNEVNGMLKPFAANPMAQKLPTKAKDDSAVKSHNVPDGGHHLPGGARLERPKPAFLTEPLPKLKKQSGAHPMEVEIPSRPKAGSSTQQQTTGGACSRKRNAAACALPKKES